MLGIDRENSLKILFAPVIDYYALFFHSSCCKITELQNFKRAGGKHPVDAEVKRCVGTCTALFSGSITTVTES